MDGGGSWPGGGKLPDTTASTPYVATVQFTLWRKKYRIKYALGLNVYLGRGFIWAHVPIA